VDGIALMPGRICTLCSIPTVHCLGGSRMKSNGPRSWSPSRASGSRRSASILSAPEATITSARVSVAGRFRFGLKKGRCRSMSPWRSSKSLRFRGLLAQADEDDVAVQLDDADLVGVAGQIRDLYTSARHITPA
jgi:hypothetical protein